MRIARIQKLTTLAAFVLLSAWVSQPAEARGHGGGGAGGGRHAAGYSHSSGHAVHAGTAARPHGAAPGRAAGHATYGYYPHGGHGYGHGYYGHSPYYGHYYPYYGYPFYGYPYYGYYGSGWWGYPGWSWGVSVGAPSLSFSFGGAYPSPVEAPANAAPYAADVALDPSEEDAAAPGSAPRMRQGLLKILVTPADATIRIDGEFLATAGELARLHGAIPVAEGVHRIEVAGAGYASKALEVDVHGRQPVRVQIDLTK